MMSLYELVSCLWILILSWFCLPDSIGLSSCCCYYYYAWLEKSHQHFNKHPFTIRLPILDGFLICYAYAILCQLVVFCRKDEIDEILSSNAFMQELHNQIGIALFTLVFVLLNINHIILSVICFDYIYGPVEIACKICCSWVLEILVLHYGAY